MGCANASAQNLPGADCSAEGGTIRVADDALVTPDMARIDQDAARAAALREMPGATVTELELDEEDGFLVYEADLVHDGAEYELLIDAGTGRVLCAERD
jgi:uncharacterized membrane protein YkoI